ncbi:g5853 [Coccomyxa elongata]
MATAHPSRRAQHDDTENNGADIAPHAASSTGSAAVFYSQQSEKSDTDTEEPSAARDSRKRKRPGPVPKLEHMTLQDFQRGGYFDMQLEEAAAKLGVGRTVLTRRVRQLGIQRWPYRRRASMKSLILKTRLYLSWQSAAQHPAEQAPTQSIVDLLHQEMDPCKGGKDELLNNAIMRYRQSFFKQEHIAKKTGVAITDHHK